MTEKGGASMIHQHIESEKQLTIHTCSGTILKQEFMDAIKALYASEYTPHHLWNLTGSDLSQIEADDLQEIAEFAKQNTPTRIGGRTALVSDSIVGFGLARMFEVFAENVDLPVEISVFYSPEEAEEWMSSVPGKDLANRLYQSS
jgi:acyl CoA:acetate/3-ketoacid CoA transferase